MLSVTYRVSMFVAGKRAIAFTLAASMSRESHNYEWHAIKRLRLASSGWARTP